jgi:hypothetical protein
MLHTATSPASAHCCVACLAGDALFWWQGRQTSVTRDHNGLLLEQLTQHSSCLACCTGPAAVKYGEHWVPTGLHGTCVIRQPNNLPACNSAVSLHVLQQLCYSPASTIPSAALNQHCPGLRSLLWQLLSKNSYHNSLHPCSALLRDPMLPLPAHPALLHWAVTLPTQGMSQLAQGGAADAISRGCLRCHKVSTGQADYVPH